MNAEDLSIELFPDYQLAAKHWIGEGIPTLALHGWLDNASSFDAIAPLLRGVNLYALDFSGHGLSSHKPAACFFHLLDLVTETIMVANALGWEKFALLGHSLGAAVASYTAGALGDRISHLMLLDGLGALTTPPEKAPDQYQRFLKSALKQSTSKVPVYPSIEAAAEARVKAAPIDLDSAKLLAHRGTKKVDNGITWRTDPRLLQPSAIQLTDEQTYAFLKKITAPTLVVRPEPGYDFKDVMMKNRLKCIKNLKLVKVQGDHHVHLDDAGIVAPHINQFLMENHL